jgi:hypothetical protein
MRSLYYEWRMRRHLKRHDPWVSAFRRVNGRHPQHGEVPTELRRV